MQFEAMRSLSKYLSVTSKLKIKYTKKKNDNTKINMINFLSIFFLIKRKYNKIKYVFFLFFTGCFLHV